jgi:hypothetical protein
LRPVAAVPTYLCPQAGQAISPMRWQSPALKERWLWSSARAVTMAQAFRQVSPSMSGSWAFSA